MKGVLRRDDAAPLSFACRPVLRTFADDMDSNSEILKKLADEVNAKADASEIVDKLVSQAKDGDTDSIKLLAELKQQAEERRLRQELFGV